MNLRLVSQFPASSDAYGAISEVFLNLTKFTGNFNHVWNLISIYSRDKVTYFLAWILHRSGIRESRIEWVHPWTARIKDEKTDSQNSVSNLEVYV